MVSNDGQIDRRSMIYTEYFARGTVPEAYCDLHPTRGIMTLVPTRLYYKNGRVKVAVSLAKGKQAYDKRETIKRREAERETRAAVKSRR